MLLYDQVVSSKFVTKLNTYFATQSRLPKTETGFSIFKRIFKNGANRIKISYLRKRIVNESVKEKTILIHPF